jgi:hypothetical protein
MTEQVIIYPHALLFLKCSRPHMFSSFENGVWLLLALYKTGSFEQNLLNGKTMLTSYDWWPLKLQSIERWSDVTYPATSNKIDLDPSDLIRSPKRLDVQTHSRLRIATKYKNSPSKVTLVCQRLCRSLH